MNQKWQERRGRPPPYWEKTGTREGVEGRLGYDLWNVDSLKANKEEIRKNKITSSIGKRKLLQSEVVIVPATPKRYVKHPTNFIFRWYLLVIYLLDYAYAVDYPRVSTLLLITKRILMLEEHKLFLQWPTYFNSALLHDPCTKASGASLRLCRHVPTQYVSQEGFL